MMEVVMAGELGNFAGGFAAARDARKQRQSADANTSMLKSLISGKPASGGGATPEAATPVITGGATGTGATPAKPTFTDRLKKGLAKAGKSIMGFEKGGQVTRTGVALVHKGEHIIPAGQSVERKAIRKSTRRSGRR
jgi:hypothetical protein